MGEKEIWPPSIYRRLKNKETEKDEVRKGYVPVLVGKGAILEKIFIPTKLLMHPDIVALLKNSAEEFGYQQHGLLKIPYDSESFKLLVKNISKRK
ncbi:hypothetical protein CMV_011484 [Castanea mollissima]|uniref:Uncharacterized protein n=1 Tax=Castanea mollissima TaxID=60419 RepID=A0A8J4R1Y2_9ROSI|nr:hypothetical protein CMV_011484 [Castanea mollissima]